MVEADVGCEKKADCEKSSAITRLDISGLYFLLIIIASWPGPNGVDLAIEYTVDHGDGDLILFKRIAHMSDNVSRLILGNSVTALKRI